MQTLRILLFSALILLLGGCSQKAMIPEDTRVYGSPSQEGVRYSEHRFASDHNGSVSGWWLENRQGKPKGVLVLVPGAVNNISYHYRQWLWLLDAGYDVFMFDYRGYGESTGEQSLEGYFADTRAALRYVSEHTRGDIFVCGQSMGGVILANVMESYRDEKIKLLIIDSAFSSFRKISRDILAKSVVMSPLWWLPALVTERRYDAIEKVSAITTPTLYISGTADRTVSPDYVFLLFMRATAAREFWVVENAAHIHSLSKGTVQKAFVALLGEGNGMMKRHFSAIKMFEDE